MFSLFLREKVSCRNIWCYPSVFLTRYSSILVKHAGRLYSGSSLVRHNRCISNSLAHLSVGPYGAGIFDPRAWGGGDEDVTNMITLEFSRVVLAIGVFAIGVELPKAYMARHWKSILFLLVPVMTWVSIFRQTRSPLFRGLWTHIHIGLVCIRGLDILFHPRPQFLVESGRRGLPYPYRPNLSCRSRWW